MGSAQATHRKTLVKILRKERREFLPSSRVAHLKVDTAFAPSDEVQRFSKNSDSLDAALEALIEVVRKTCWQGGLAACTKNT